MKDPGSDQPCYFNPIINRRQWIKPQAPTRIPLDDEGTVLLAEDERDRVLPSHMELARAGRYDLHWAITSHGGYKAVSPWLHKQISTQPSREAYMTWY